jgi:hypothetical protein
MSLATQELLFTQNLLKEMGGCETPGMLFEDNVGAIHLVKNRQVGQRTKHIDCRHHFMRDTWEEGKMTINYVDTNNNEADICTKNVIPTLHEKHRNNIREGQLNIWNEYETLVSMPRKEDRMKQTKNVRDIDTDAVNATSESTNAEKDEDEQKAKSESEEYVETVNAVAIDTIKIDKTMMRMLTMSWREDVEKDDDKVQAIVDHQPCYSTKQRFEKREKISL